MNKFFNPDSPAMRFLSKMADLMILNIAALLCCLPIITIGASLTAMHYVLLKMVRNEEGYILRSFFKSWKENFKQATIIWFPILLFIIVFTGDLMIFKYSGIEFPQILKALLLAAAVFVYMVSCYVFPILSRFHNTVRNTWKNALLMSICSFPRTVAMMVLYILPFAACLNMMTIPLVFFFGLSLPAYASAILYDKIFRKYAPEEEALTDSFELAAEATGAGEIVRSRDEAQENKG